MKAAKASIEEQWAKMLRDHSILVEAWATECGRLRAAGIPAKNLPKKPKRPLKPKPEAAQSGSGKKRIHSDDEREDGDDGTEVNDVESEEESDTGDAMSDA